MIWVELNGLVSILKGELILLQLDVALSSVAKNDGVESMV